MNVRALLVPAEVLTVIAGAPPPPVSAAPMVAVNCVSLTGVVVTLVAEPFHKTVPPSNPAPFTVKEKALLPARTETGEIEVMCGFVKVKLLRRKFQAPRPWVLAMRVLDAA